MLSLQLVFWLSAISGVMNLLIIVIVSDLRDIFLRAWAIALLLFLVLCDLSSINPNCDEATVSSFSSLLLSLMSPSFLFFLGLFLGLHNLGSLFSLVSLILTLILGSCTGF